MGSVVDRTIHKLESLISRGDYEQLETDKLEIKDNSSTSSDWTEVYTTACAFLNTSGGIIYIGIKEEEAPSKYVLTGYRSEQEDKLKNIYNVFEDDEGKPIKNIKNHIYFQQRTVLDKTVLLVFVEELQDDHKYAFLKKKKQAYERIITGDHKISKEKIKIHREYKREIVNSRELKLVPNTTLDDLDIDKLNDYIQKLNQEIKTETLKPSIQEAIPFLHRKDFIRNSEPTTLGMLVCGKYVEDKLRGRCQADCFVESDIDIASSKQTIKNNILPLMEACLAFVARNIQIGVSAARGGTKTPEYPEKLIRESINNSLAHRDYDIDKYININIHPGKAIEIRNPGRFKESLLIKAVKHRIPLRRIIPGNPKANNPRLAEVLKVYDKWEGKGYGMATLTNSCLDNEIDLPYYKFHSRDELSLFIPKGKVFDQEMENLIDLYGAYIYIKLNGNEMTQEQKVIFSYFYKSELANRQDYYTILLTKDNNHFNAIESLVQAKLLIRHELSNDINTIYYLDQTFFQKDFNTELRDIFGGAFDDLTQEYKQILNIIYQYNNFSKIKYPSASQIGDIIWVQEGKSHVIKGLESFKRKNRSRIQKLFKKEFLVKESGKPKYIINNDFDRIPSLFDDI